MRDDAVPAITVTEQTATLLWEACRRDPDPASLRRALAGGADICLSVSAASDQRSARCCGGRWAVGLARCPRARWGRTRSRGQRLQDGGAAPASRAVALAVRPLTDAGLEPVVFKGPAVAARYPEPGLRPMDDIDLLLPEADHRLALETLRHVGWQVARPGGRRHVRHRADLPRGALVLPRVALRAGGRVATGDGARFRRLWARRQPLESAGTRHSGCPPPRSSSCWPPTPAGRTTGSRGSSGGGPGDDRGSCRRHGAAIDWDRCAPWRDGTVRDGGRLRLGDGPPGRPGRAGPACSPCPPKGRRGDAMRRLLSVTWPLTNLELPGWQLRYSVPTDARAAACQRPLLQPSFSSVTGFAARACRGGRPAAPCRPAPAAPGVGLRPGG